MYAVIETGGKQYLVEKNDVIRVEKIALEPGNEIVLDRVLMTGGDSCRVGSPYLENVLVKGQVIAQGRGPKLLVFKRRRRKDSKSLRGHRQDYTAIRITAIEA